MQSEKNTYATSSYIASDSQSVLDYLNDLKNLDEWTVNCRMHTQVDDSTWVGKASGYQEGLRYHIKRHSNGPFQGIEWHCGLDGKPASLVYPTFVFDFEKMGMPITQKGIYLHWIAFSHPVRRGPIYKYAVEPVHNAELLSLKSCLENKAGFSSIQEGDYEISSDTMFVDVDMNSAISFLSTPDAMTQWSLFVKADGTKDEYSRPISITSEVADFGTSKIIDMRIQHTDEGFSQFCPTMIIPASYAFNEKDARGVLLHRVYFTPKDKISYVKRVPEQIFSELISLKRILEARADRYESFNNGWTWRT